MRIMLVVCASIILNSQFPILNTVSAQNYSTEDTVTEYPNKGTYYHDKFEGRKTANGEVFDQNAFTAAHWRIKLGTHILVTNVNTGLQVIVKVNDRCPKRGVIDLSHRAANAIGIRGCQPVTVRLLPDGYEEQCLAQDEAFDSVRSRLSPNAPPPSALKVSLKQPEPAVAGTTEDAPRQQATPKKQHTFEPHQTASDDDCYTLVVCVVATHGEAYSQVQKLPTGYREKALVEELDDGDGLRVTLDVRLRRRQADDLCRALTPRFPGVHVMPCQ